MLLKRVMTLCFQISNQRNVFNGMLKFREMLCMDYSEDNLLAKPKLMLIICKILVAWVTNFSLGSKKSGMNIIKMSNWTLILGELFKPDRGMKTKNWNICQIWTYSYRRTIHHLLLLLWLWLNQDKFNKVNIWMTLNGMMSMETSKITRLDQETFVYLRAPVVAFSQQFKQNGGNL